MRLQLQQELTIVKICTNDIQMEFSLDKYTTAVFTHGKLSKSQNIGLNSQAILRIMELDKT